MDKERLQIKTKLLNFLAFIDDSNKQQEIINLLMQYEEKIPDGRLIDTFQKIKRKRMDYYSLCEDLVDDLLDKKMNVKSREILSSLLNKLTPVIENEPKKWWGRFVESIKNATGTK